MRVWEWLSFVASTYYLVVVPLRLAYPNILLSPQTLILDALCSVLLVIDLVLRAFVAYEDDESSREADKQTVYSTAADSVAHGHLVVDRARILKRYLRGRFWFGLAAAIPLDLIAFAMGMGGDAIGGSMVGGYEDPSSPLGVTYGWGEAVPGWGEFAL